MTPMESAREAYEKSSGGHKQCLTTAISAYLQAVAKDEGTVEAVARRVLENMEHSDVEIESIMAASEPDSDRGHAIATAKAAIQVLASRVKA